MSASQRSNDKLAMASARRRSWRRGFFGGFLPWRGMREGKLGDGGGDGPRNARRGLRCGESVDVEEPMDEMEDTERVGDFMFGLGFILYGLSGI